MRKKTWETLSLLNPVNHALDRTMAERYKVEPYVISADVYANPQHLGRGGWSWYTGSASWLYRFMLEEILGFKLTPGWIRVAPASRRPGAVSAYATGRRNPAMT